MPFRRPFRITLGARIFLCKFHEAPVGPKSLHTDAKDIVEGKVGCPSIRYGTKGG
jgi:hypothetical protein